MIAFLLSFLRRILQESLWIACILFTGVLFGAWAIYLFGTTEVENLADYPLYQTSFIYDRTGTKELYRLYDEENRRILPHDEIPESIRLATIAAEDERFYSHFGVDPIAMLRALKADFEAGRIVEGGSTITQQLAKRLFLSNERTLERKIREIFLAIKIDRHTDKDALLDLYLNAVPYGSNAYGIQAAAETFFGKDARDLTLDESAFLAALPNAPTTLSPYRLDTSELIRRQEHILRRMLTLGFISEYQYVVAAQTEVLNKLKPPTRSITAPHFVFYVIDRLREEFGEDRLRTAGLRVITTLDLDLQEAAEESVRQGAARNLARGATNAALVALDPRTGEILAMVGSRDYFDPSVDGNVNVTVEARQPGSAFKPFAYATAFEKGYQPESIVYDIPTNFGPDGSGKPYIPKNYDGKFRGRMTMRQALSQSLNVPAVQTLALAGVKDTIALASRLGITTLTDPDRYGLALVLGGAEVRPLDMASAFGVFGQEGMRHPATPFLSVSDDQGTALTIGGRLPATQVLAPEIARKISSILSDNAARTPIFGPRSPLAFPSGTGVAGKTGTTQNFRDAWTVGFTSSLSVAVWAGNNDNTPMRPGSDGIFVAAPIWRSFMDQALLRFPPTPFPPYVAAETPRETRTPRLIYINKKTGREISPAEARKKKPENVEVREVWPRREDSGTPGETPALPEPVAPENIPTEGTVRMDDLYRNFSR